MFEALKKKFSSWIKKPEPVKKQEKKAKSKKKAKVEKPKKISKAASEKQQKDKKQKIISVEKETPEEIKVESEIQEENIELELEEIKEKENIQTQETKEESNEESQKTKPKWWEFKKKQQAKEIEENIEKQVQEIKEKEQIETQETKEEIQENQDEGFFSKLIKKITTSKLSQEDFDEFFADLEITLLENNTALDTVDKIKESLSKDLIGKELKKNEAEVKVLNSLKEAILSVLIEPQSLIEQINKKQGIFTIVFFGINGSGKTTSVAKLAHFLKKNNISCVLAAGDTFRAAAIDQLETHANRLKVPITKSQYGSDPSSVAFDARAYAKAHNIKVVLIDTAGRMYTKSNLLKEMEKIIRISQPDLKIFVGESITGNDATEQAKTFNEVIGIDGIILTKADVDEKAGTILSVSHITNKPIYFLGMGQAYDDLKPFSKSTVLENLGLG